MKDARHPKEYPRGPKVQMTPEWKELVRQRLAANKRTGKSPASRKELARIIGADPAGLGRALEGGQVTSKYASEICSVLEIETPTVPTLPSTSTNGIASWRTCERCRVSGKNMRCAYYALFSAILTASNR